MGRKKLIQNRAGQSPGQGNLRMYVENYQKSDRKKLDKMRKPIQMLVDRNGNTNLEQTEEIEVINLITNNNQNKITTRKTSRIKSTNPITRYGNPMTH